MEDITRLQESFKSLVGTVITSNITVIILISDLTLGAYIISLANKIKHYM